MMVKKSYQKRSRRSKTPARRIVTRNLATASANSKERKGLRLIPLGGLGEVGKNLMVLEYGRDILVIDMGLMFPDETMPGVDYVIPDISYLRANKEKIRGIIVTHGHEDHIGAIPYLASGLGVPIYASRLATALIEARLKEFPEAINIQLKTYGRDDILTLGAFKVEPFQVNHSIPDSFGFGIHTPEGIIVHTGDFKIDLTSPDKVKTEFPKLVKWAEENPLALLSDSTNAERRGYTVSEKAIAEAFDSIFSKAKGRLVVSSFASRIDRMQHVMNAAIKYGRKVAVSGRSMLNYFEVASRLGYIVYPQEILVPLSAAVKMPDEKIAILATGSQGQEGSSLYRMAFGEHSQVKIKKGDTVILSASPIPGNERAIGALIDNLNREGAEVIYNQQMQVHITGHAFQEELKLMMSLVKPKYFIPVHGEYHMLVANRKLAEEVGISPHNIFVIENGQVIEFSQRLGRILENKVPSGLVLVDGLGVGDVGEIVLRDRKAMAKDGMIVVIATVDKKTGNLVSSPDIISRGFVYMREKEDLINSTRDLVKRTLSRAKGSPPNDWAGIKTDLRERVGNFLYDQTRRRPMVLPVVIEV